MYGLFHGDIRKIGQPMGDRVDLQEQILPSLRSANLSRLAEATAPGVPPDGFEGAIGMRPAPSCTYGSAIFFSAITSRNRSG